MPPTRLLGRSAYAVLDGTYATECLPETQITTLNAIRRWVDDDRDTTRICCLLDSPGTGKSTVAKHMTNEWKKEQRLAARFFFFYPPAQTTTSMLMHSFCPIVANTFATLDSKFKACMEEFDAHSDWRLLSFQEEFEGRVAGPLRAINRRAILTIDAIDECDNKHGMRDQLLNTLRASTPLLRVFITGRPTRELVLWAKGQAGISYINFRSNGIIRGSLDAPVATI
jgi:hypothetical protein